MALVNLSSNYLPKEWYLHTLISKKTHIKRCGVVILISHPMRTVKVSLEHPQLKGVCIHLFQKVLYVTIRKLPAAYILIVVYYVRVLLTVVVLLI